MEGHTGLTPEVDMKAALFILMVVTGDGNTEYPYLNLKIDSAQMDITMDQCWELAAAFNQGFDHMTGSYIATCIPNLFDSQPDKYAGADTKTL